MGKKNFYAAAIDDYQYSEVTEKRYKNFVDFAIEQWGEEEMESQLRNYIEGSKLVNYIKPTYRATIDAKALYDLAGNVATIFNTGDDTCINLCMIKSYSSWQRHNV